MFRGFVFLLHFVGIFFYKISQYELPHEILTTLWFGTSIYWAIPTPFEQACNRQWAGLRTFAIFRWHVFFDRASEDNEYRFWPNVQRFCPMSYQDIYLVHFLLRHYQYPRSQISEILFRLPSLLNDHLRHIFDLNYTSHY